MCEPYAPEKRLHVNVNNSDISEKKFAYLSYVYYIIDLL